MDLGPTSGADNEVSHRPAKRKKTDHGSVKRVLARDSYNVAWICALHVEMAAAMAMLDEIHGELPRRGNDNNAYVLGSIGNHNIVVTCLPLAQYGNTNSAHVVTSLIHTFPSIRRGLMVGIGGGAPAQADVRLGDVVVGTRVMQSDFGKIVAGGGIQRTAVPKQPDFSLRTAVTNLRAVHELQPSRILAILQERLGGNEGYGRPSTPDRLFHSSYSHPESVLDCSACDPSCLIERKTRRSQDPMIYYGAVASGNQVIKDATTRDKIAQELDVVCFEMEAAGLMDVLPCLSIRGICDYADSHKAKEWQKYAAAVAAAYAREFLENLAAQDLGDTPDSDVLGTRASSDPNNDPIRANPAMQNGQLNRREQLMNSLKFDQIDSRKTDIKAAYPKTCQWFLKHPDYLEWLELDKQKHHHGFLWIRGKPGAGKSIIMKFIYRRLKKKDQPLKVLTSSFFFNARGDCLEKSVSGMYRSLLLQLLEGFPDLQQVLDDPELVPRNQVGCPSVNVLKELFRSAVLLLRDRSFTCFVDALDECDEQQVKDMVEFFEELAESCTEQKLRLRICFSSRHYPYIDIQHGIRQTLEDQPGHAEDLSCYIGKHLKIRHPPLLDELRLGILEKAKGVFLWVALVVDVLNKENNRGRLALRKRLKEVPSGLSELFKDILTRDQENMEELLLSILWILFAERPLKPEEYYHALWFSLALDEEDPNDIEVPEVDMSDAKDCFHKCVVSSSKGLAEITKALQPTVQFIHESVRDFLVKDKGILTLWPSLGADWESHSHERLKLCCLAYTQLQQVQQLITDQQPNVTSRLQGYSGTKSSSLLELKYPFTGYAVQFLLYHADSAAETIAQEEFLAQFSVPAWIRMHNIFEKHKVRKYGELDDILYVLADKGLSRLIQARLRENPSIDVRGSRYEHPLKAAMAQGHKDSVVILLGLTSRVHDGVDLTESLRSDIDSCRKNQTPLSWACENGHLEIAKILAQRGASIKGVKLVRTLENGHAEVVEWLINNGCGVEDKDRQGNSLLHIAAYGGRDTVVQLLLDKGVNIELRNDHGWTPLLWASQNGHTSAAQLLLDKGANIESRDNNGRTPLSWATSLDSTHSVAQFLLDQGANIESRNDDGQTPLLWASQNGLTSAAQLLLDKGANIESRDNNGRTPLSWASWTSNSSMAQLLLDKGANIESRDNDVAQLLLDKGANIESRDNDGRTPLSWAASNTLGYPSVVLLLLGEGADIESNDKNGRTPLSWASIDGNSSVIRLLLDQGANVHSMDHGGRTSLS